MSSVFPNLHIVGLTGGIATGKSTVASYLSELGARVIDADAISRDVTAPGTPGSASVLGRFGPSVQDESGHIDRKALGRLVFRDPEARRRLEGIVHPLVMDEIRAELREMNDARDGAHVGKPRVVFLDIPLLYEVGADLLADEVWVVATDRHTQIERIMARDRLSCEEAKQRIDSQMPLEEKKTRATEVIENSGPIAETQARVRFLWDCIRRRID